MAVILHIPETLRARLGEDGARDLAALIDQAEIAEKTAAVESRLVWKVLAFLAGQTGVLYLLIKAAH
jgi:hypothetical protein